jgi:hypothetical protein
MKFFENNKKLSIFILIVFFVFYAYFLRAIETNKLVDKKSIQYTNSIYMSDGRFYSYLDEYTQKLYIKLLDSIKNYKRNYKINIKNDNCTTLENCAAMGARAMEAIIMDHPELLQVSSYMWMYNPNEDMENVTLRIRYAINFSFLSKLGELRILRIIDDIKNETKNMTEIEKIKYVYEWIGKTSEYNRIFSFSDSNQSAFTVFINHKSVCAGFAKASQLIFQNIGIESYYVTGISTGPHAFNIVKVKDKYYLYDSTVASCISESNSQFYDGLKQSYLQTFSIDHKQMYPELDNEEIFLS